MFRKFILGFIFISIFSYNISSMGGSIPSGLPTYFGFGCMDNFSLGWKGSQGSSCWDYTYVYLTQGWRLWNGDDPSYAMLNAQHFEPYNQFQVFTYYYNNGNISQYNQTLFMTTYFNDLKLLFQKINQYSTKKCIVHIDPDLLGFWTTSGYSVTQSGVVAVGSTGISDIASIENNIRGWHRAIYTLKNNYAPSKALIAHHISPWCFGFDIMNSSVTEEELTTRVFNITN
ncbi:MAG: hypothetical protein N3E50_05195 [Candidatus Goldbacteria bacterium]|nr:hypothetical protein [Candidatus Goldiibacteriota bacterium]